MPTKRNCKNSLFTFNSDLDPVILIQANPNPRLECHY